MPASPTASAAPQDCAVSRACLFLPTGSEKHRTRRIIASKIIESANRGDTTLSRLTEAGYAAAMQLAASDEEVNNLLFMRTEYHAQLEHIALPSNIYQQLVAALRPGAYAEQREQAHKALTTWWMAADRRSVPLPMPR